MSRLSVVYSINALNLILNNMVQPHELITRRWSPVAFDSRPIEAKKIQLLFEAARWAPSSMNTQPWRFIYATREMQEYTMLFDLLDEGNKVWARTAPLLMLGLSQVISIYKNRPNRFAFYDTGMAVGNLLLQATHMDLFVHQMGGYDVDRAKDVLVIPTRYEPAAMMAIGYKGDPSQLSSKEAEREQKERTRMEIDQFLVPGKCK